MAVPQPHRNVLRKACNLTDRSDHAQVCVDGLRGDAAVMVGVASDVDVALVAPVRRPRVLHDPVVLAVRRAPIPGWSKQHRSSARSTMLHSHLGLAPFQASYWPSDAASSHQSSQSIPQPENT